ncbi:helix-turn-helix domain-containing protein [Azospirillum brasilense]|uniref:helix-turn-helix domain-containing protein n=1 Tax=Azospirillum argentinense TaxID=2970906 RepID=UPI00190BD848|nr:helix-turn-helix transcriptional regulator [Azospirillum argentinense]MBK3800578.1 helix-turn-helix domain-containing protein [Azospirillum argentinense]
MLPIQCKLARTALGWGVRDVAARTGMSPATITRFERGDQLRDRTVATLRHLFESNGLEFIDEADGKGPGLRFRQSLPTTAKNED